MTDARHSDPTRLPVDRADDLDRVGMGRLTATTAIPPDLFLADYAPEIRDVAERLRDVVDEAVPEAIERVRIGWRLIGYNVPVGRRTPYFAFVAPEPEHVHLGFEYGAWMTDADGLLLGAHLNLKKVRFVTYLPGDAIPTDALVRYTREAAELASVPSLGRNAPSR